MSTSRSPHLLTDLVVLTAIPEEDASIRKILTPYSQSTRPVGGKLNIEVSTFTIGPRLIRIANSGIGPVNAALTVHAIAEAYPSIKAVVLLGVGGALVSQLKIGDLVVSNQVLQHDSYSSLDFGNPRMKPGHYLLTSDDVKGHAPHLSADPMLVQWFSHLLPADRLTVGTILSGGEFVGTRERKRHLHAIDPTALLVDMESGGVAQTCTRLGIPFVIAKTVADRLDPDGSIQQDFTQCLHAAADHASQLFHELLC